MRVILLLLFVLFLSSCSSKNKTTVASSLGTTSSSTTITHLDGMGAISGSLVMSTNTPTKTVVAQDAEIKFAGHPEYDTKANKKGEVSIPNIIPGTYTIYAEATLPAALAQKGQLRATGDEPRMAQFKDIVISASGETVLPETVLTKPGSLSGTVSLINNPTNVSLDGIMVFIPGTSYMAMTNNQGVFSMTEVPAGAYDSLRFSKDGLTTSDLSDIEVLSGQDEDVGEVRMSLSTGPSGAIVGIDDAEEVAGVTYPVLSQGVGDTVVTVNLRYDTRAVLMKVAHESSFLNVEWIPVAPTYTFTNDNNEDAIYHFETDGIKSVYVKFADLNGLESSVYYTRFIIDNSVPVIDSVTLLFGWGNVGTTDQGDGSYAYQKVPVLISSVDDGTGIKEMIICNNEDFIGCEWETYSSHIDAFDLEDGTAGGKTVYVKVKDFLGNISLPVSDTIVVSTYTIITSSTDDLVTLNKEWGPYSYDSNISFTGDLTINPGVIIYYKDDFTITVEGILTIAGSDDDPVELKEYQDGQEFAGFVLNTGLGGPHSINYLKMESGNYNDGYLFKMNGGEIKNSNLYVQKSLLHKTGSQTFSFNNNTISGPGVGLTMMLPLILLEDGGNTLIEHNDFTMDLSDGAGSPVMITGKTLYTGATIQYNKFYFTDDPTGGRFSNNVLLRTETGETSFKYNDVSFTLDNTNSTSPKIFHALNSSSIEVAHNNLAMAANMAASVALKYFVKENAATIDAGNTSALWNYTGTFAVGECGGSGQAVISSCGNDSSFKFCGDSPTVMTGCRTAPYSTMAGVSGCVGVLCLGTEN